MIILRSLSTTAVLVFCLCAAAGAHHSRGNFDLENVRQQPTPESRVR